ncbi:hypothetical protein KKG36_01640 [Patescibacteria group bacterium]|nr:hypothetical protein [Patescibacteria group bacterium]
MKKIIVILIIVAAIFGAFFLASGRKGDAKIILFYSEACPHCKVVEEYIEENKVEEKISFEKMESSENSELLVQKADFCKMDTSQGVPIPFLWVNNQCIVGDQDIIKFLQSL